MFNPIKKEQDMITKMQKEIHEQPNVLKQCLQSNKDFMEKVIADIKSREINNVVIAARGTSDHAAIYGKYIIEYMLGIPVSLAAPSILTMYNKELDLKHSLVIGISQSGEAEDVLEVILSAKKQNAICITITNNIDSPLAKTSGYHLHTNAGKEESVAATKTFTSQMMMLALLVAYWSDNKKMMDELNQIPKELQKVLKLEKKIIEKVQRYRYMENCFVLARGMNYPMALESALKIQETTYVHANGYAISDFHHGPFAMIAEGIPVIIFAPDGPSLDDAKEMIEKLREAGAEIILVTNDKNIDNYDDITFSIPDAESDMITPFYNVCWAQMFACHLSLAKGMNPDSPRGLKKVTITR